MLSCVPTLHSLPTAEQYSMVWIHSIHSPADGHLGCFQVLAVANKAAMNIKAHHSLYAHTLSRLMNKYGGAEWLALPVNVCKSF